MEYLLLGEGGGGTSFIIRGKRLTTNNPTSSVFIHEASREPCTLNSML